MSKLEDYFNDILRKINDADGKSVETKGDIIKSKLGKDDREAWVNYAVESHLKGVTDEMDDIPEDFDIREKDIINELVTREIEKFLGK